MNLSKTVIFVFALTCAQYHINAQINVISSGNVGIENDAPASKFSIGASGNANSKAYIQNSSSLSGSIGLTLYQLAPSDNANPTFGGVSTVQVSSLGNKHIGFCGYAYSSTPLTTGGWARAYGLYGYAGNAYQGYNYGVIGRLLGSNGGTAIFGTTSTNDLNVTTNAYAGLFHGNVYIGGGGKLSVNRMTADYQIDVTGQIRADNLQVNSDERLKDNIATLISPISKINSLRGVSYNLINPQLLKNENSIDSLSTETNISQIDTSFYNRTHFGLIAQELQQSLPELVYKDRDGFLSVDYIALIPLLVEGLKEQQLIINAQGSKIEELRKIIDANNNLKSGLVSDIGSSTGTINAYLFQNSPNPFNHQTEIKYFLPSTESEGIIYILDLQGKILREFKISNYGPGSIIINSAELEPGIYIYTLVIEGVEMDTKRMILTR